TAIKKGDDASIRRGLATLNWLAAPFGTEEYMERKFGAEGTDYTSTDGIPKLTPTGSTDAALPLQYITDSAPVLGPGPKVRIDAQYDYHKTVGGLLLADPSIGLYSPTYAKQGATLAKIVSDAQTEILLGHQPASSWPTVVKQWQAAGGDAMTAEYSKAYAEAAS
ncbi:MAG: putative aldouronate transport system substrate-binding protein, partial [Subtercola sp.]|nr:putative aldouronate transport system substrate-binding protein [Subtercola sp.]